MFQPQPTPYSASSFASYPYGLGAAHSLDFLFPTGGAAGIAAGGVAGGAGVGASAGVGAGAGPGSALGPASCGALYNPYSSPSPHSQLQHHHHQPLPQRRRQLNRSGSPIIKMEEQDSGLHDMAAQQAAAERFQPGLEVRFLSAAGLALKMDHGQRFPIPTEFALLLSLPFVSSPRFIRQKGATNVFDSLNRDRL